MDLSDIAAQLRGHSTAFETCARLSRSALSALPADTFLADHRSYPRTTSFSLRHGPELVWRLATLIGVRSRSFDVLRSHRELLRHLETRPESLLCRSCRARFDADEGIRFCDMCGQPIHDADPCNLRLVLSDSATKGTQVVVCKDCFEWVYFADRSFFNGKVPLRYVQAINRENLDSSPLQATPFIHPGNVAEWLARLADEDRP